MSKTETKKPNSQVRQTFLSVEKKKPNPQVRQTFLSVEKKKQKPKENPLFLEDLKSNNIQITKRHLPHWTMKEAVYYVTFHLKKGSLLKREQLVVKDHILKGKDTFYHLIACQVMPDHTHVVFKPLSVYTLKRIMKGLKGVSSRKVNLSRGTRGNIWQDESYDRIVRNQKALREIANYMLNNPYKAGLTKDPWHYHGWYFNNSCPDLL